MEEDSEEEAGQGRGGKRRRRTRKRGGREVDYVRGSYLPLCLHVAVSGTSAGPKATQLPLSAAQRVEGDEGVQMERRGGLCDGGRMGGGWDREGWRWRRGRR